MKDAKKNSIQIKFDKSKNYNMYAATGAWGGVGPQGEIICHFFVEHQKIPEDLEIEIEENSGKSKEIRKEANKLVRDIQCTIVMRPDIAKSIAEWLLSNVNKILVVDKLQSTKESKK